MCRTAFDHFNNVSIDKNNVLVRSSEKVKKLDEKKILINILEKEK